MQNIIKTKFSCQRNGLIIQGTEYRPKGSGLPIAIVSHGFMANQATVKHYAQFLAKMGYAAFCFDFCGGCAVLGKSQGKTTKMSVQTEVCDLLAVIEYTRTASYTGAARVLLMGCSQGGLVSALTAAKLKKQVESLVLFYPAFCIPDDARKGKMMWARFDPKNIPDTLRCGPMKLGRCYVADVIQMDPFAEIKGYEGDVLIVHGSSDKIVNIRYAQQAAQAYKAEPINRKTVFHVIEGAGHGFSKRHDRAAMEYLSGFLS
ncbi:MAG: alpha/beta hydrolase [Acutalibacter sp.]|nr:alpha/beta hydrolase [Acutalibacter sp.]